MLIDISNAYKSGRTSALESAGLTKDQIASATGLSTDEAEELAANYARTCIARSKQTGVINFRFDELVALASKRLEEENLVRSFIEAKASNRLMDELFGKRSTDCATLRKRFKVDNNRGRKSEPKGEEVCPQIHALYREAMKQRKCKRQALMDVYERTGHPIDFIHRVVTDNGEFPL